LNQFLIFTLTVNKDRIFIQIFFMIIIANGQIIIFIMRTLLIFNLVLNNFLKIYVFLSKSNIEEGGISSGNSI